jgi:hypothetical protein
VRCNRRYAEEKRSLARCRYSFVEKTDGSGSHKIGRVLIGKVTIYLLVSNHGRVVKNVGSRIYQEIGSIPAIDPRIVVCGRAMAIHHLSGIICIVSRVLQPNRKIVVVETLLNKARISTYI